MVLIQILVSDCVFAPIAPISVLCLCFIRHLLLPECLRCSEPKVFSKFEELEQHMRKQHELFCCKLCTKHLKVYSSITSSSRGMLSITCQGYDSFNILVKLDTLSMYDQLQNCLCEHFNGTHGCGSPTRLSDGQKEMVKCQEWDTMKSLRMKLWCKYNQSLFL